MSTPREYPTRPVPAVGAFVWRGDAILMVQRERPPNAGRWSVPGGVVEEGETVEAATVREVREECGLVVRPGRVFYVSNLVERDTAGRIRFHYVLIDLVCDYVSGEVVPGSDAANAAWLTPSQLTGHDVSETARAAIQALLAERRA